MPAPRSLALLVICACSGGAARPTPRAPGADPLARVAWMEGRWQGPPGAGTAEHWTRVGDGLFGVGFTAKDGRTAFFEVLVIQMEEGVPVYTGMPGGRAAVKFRLSESAATEQSATFSNPAHDFPKTVHYQRKGDALAARVAAPGARSEEFTWRLGPSGRAGDLEAADRDFAAQVAARGIEAWVEWFDPEGAQWGGEPYVGRGRIHHLMAPTFARPGFRLAWAPVASGMSPAEDLGYTVGRSRATWQTESGAAAPPYCGVYVTVWRRQSDRTWRALFDAGWPQPCAD